MERLKRYGAVIVLLVGCTLLWICSKKPGETPCTKQLFAMDTVMSFTAYGENSEAAVDAAMAEVERLDALLSTGKKDSEIARLNGAEGFSGGVAGGQSVSEDTFALFQRGIEIYGDTEGAFDFTLYPLMRLWGFPTGEYHVPGEKELQAVLPLVDASKVSLEEATKEVRLGTGQQADFGGIAKGYASARVMEIYEAYGVTSGMVSFGGNVQVFGAKPDGSDWRVGIQDPTGERGETVALLFVRDCAVVTSGGYERYFEEGGKRYIHILDSATGRPAEGDLLSVTVISGDGTLADALSTALYIMGSKEAISYWRESAYDFDMVLITKDGEICATEGIFAKLEVKGHDVKEVSRKE